MSGLDWTGLTFCTNCIHDTKRHATITCSIVFVATLGRLCSHIPNPQNAGRGQQGGACRLEHTLC